LNIVELTKSELSTINGGSELSNWVNFALGVLSIAMERSVDSQYMLAVHGH
jgi:bacteriocin-like protein